MSVDQVISTYQKSGSLSVGIGIGLISTLANRIIPRLPKRYFHICDYPLVQVAILTFLLNIKLKNPTLAFLSSTILLFIIKAMINSYVPETPSLGNMIAHKDDKKSTSTPSEQSKTCTCTCRL